MRTSLSVRMEPRFSAFLQPGLGKLAGGGSGEQGSDCFFFKRPLAGDCFLALAEVGGHRGCVLGGAAERWLVRSALQRC